MAWRTLDECRGETRSWTCPPVLCCSRPVAFRSCVVRKTSFARRITHDTRRDVRYRVSRNGSEFRYPRRLCTDGTSDEDKKKEIAHCQCADSRSDAHAPVACRHARATHPIPGVVSLRSGGAFRGRDSGDAILNTVVDGGRRDGVKYIFAKAWGSSLARMSNRLPVNRGSHPHFTSSSNTRNLRTEDIPASAEAASFGSHGPIVEAWRRRYKRETPGNGQSHQRPSAGFGRDQGHFSRRRGEEHDHVLLASASLRLRARHRRSVGGAHPTARQTVKPILQIPLCSR